METLDALVQGLARFKGGIIVAWRTAEWWRAWSFGGSTTYRRSWLMTMCRSILFNQKLFGHRVCRSSLGVLGCGLWSRYWSSWCFCCFLLLWSLWLCNWPPNIDGIHRKPGTHAKVISHASEFVNQVCNEIWKVEGGVLAERTKRTIKWVPGCVAQPKMETAEPHELIPSSVGFLVLTLRKNLNPMQKRSQAGFNATFFKSRMLFTPFKPLLPPNQSPPTLRYSRLQHSSKPAGDSAEWSEENWAHWVLTGRGLERHLENFSVVHGRMDEDGKGDKEWDGWDSRES